MLSKTATIVLSQVTSHDLPLIQGDIIAVDKGCEILIKNKLNITFAIGDFDSIQPKIFKKLQKEQVDFQSYPKEKDQSDAELALAWTIEQGYANIRIIGFAGGRLDHYQAIIQMLFRFHHQGVELVTPTQSIQYLSKGTYPLHQAKFEKYFSLFTLSKANVSIQNCLYPLIKKELSVKDTLTLSNEWVNHQTVTLTVHVGEILLYRSILT